MKFVRALTPAETHALVPLHKNGATHRERQRAHALLLNAKGYPLKQLADIFDLDRDTLSQWLVAFQERGAAALADAPKSGRPPKLDAAARAWIV